MIILLWNGDSFIEEIDQGLTRREAIESFTIHPAYAAFEEKIKGSLQVGMLADDKENLLAITSD